MPNTDHPSAKPRRRALGRRQTAHRGGRTDADVRQALEAEAHRYPDAPATAIRNAVMNDPRYRGRVPEERAVRDIIRPIRTAQASDTAGAPWDFLDPAMSPEDARLVLEYIGAEQRDGRHLHPSRSWAERFVRIRRAIPELPPTLAALQTSWASTSAAAAVTYLSGIAADLREEHGNDQA